MIPAVLFRLFFDLGEPWQESLIFGVGIVGAALLLAWAAEAAQVEISGPGDCGGRIAHRFA